MIRKKMTYLTFVLLSLTTMSSCTTVTSVTDPTQLCNKLRREWIYNNANLNNEAGWTTPTQHARLKEQLREHHCE